MTEERKALYLKIASVCAEVGTIEKLGVMENGTKSYKYVRECDVIEKVNNAERNHGIYSFVSDINITESRTVNVEGKDKAILTLNVDTIEATLTVINLDTGFMTETKVMARGSDWGEKGIGSATTYARKYAKMMLYNIVTGEDIDEVKSEPVKEMLSKDRFESMQKVMKAHPEIEKEMLKAFGGESIEEFDEKTVEKIYHTLELRGYFNTKVK